ncbi:MAG: hypothetical protein ACXWJF_10645 [Burkholderiaceae bacterium]
MEDYIKKNLKIKYTGRSAKIAERSCLALVATSHERILDMRAIGMSWTEIATYLGMSVASIHQAMKQLATNANTAPRGRLMVYFDTAKDVEEFKEIVRAIQQDKPIPEYD